MGFLRGLVFGCGVLTILGWNDRPRNEPIKPIPLEVNLDKNKVRLGKKLFSDKRLSGDDSVSCASCHNLITAGVDLEPVSTGVKGQKGTLNSPTVFNSGFNLAQFWDGRAESLEDQIDGPINNPIEMGSNWNQVLEKVKSDSDYRAQFGKAYKDGITADNIKDAIATFERSLITPNSRFDQWLRGKDDALSERELLGYEKFKFYGCISCHQGVNVGGNLFQVFGVINNFFEKRGGAKEHDLGRFNVTGDERDKHSFKVPSLRLAAVTPPYLHDGSAKTLREAVDIMFTYQLGRPAPDEDKELIIEFLKTLVGSYEERDL